MKFLVLALCVCAASAASFGSTPYGSGGYKQFKGFPKAAAAAVVAPAVITAKAAENAAAVAAPVVAPVVITAKAAENAAAVVAPVVAPVVTPVAAAATATYQAGSAAYQGAKNVLNNGYSDESHAGIVRSDSEVSVDGYKYAYETENHIIGEATGKLAQVGDAAVLVSQGAFRYTSPEGIPVEVTYTADENGFHPQGDVLPVGPAIPDAILRSLAYIAANAKETDQKY